MRFPRVATAMAVLTLAVAASGLARAADEGFKPLFNGKDLAGWITPSGPTLFTVENGEIVGRTTDEKLKKNEFLVTDRDYTDFVLKAKVKYRNGNSGIQFRSKRADDGAVSGLQADIADGYWGLLYEERLRGILERYDEKKAAELIKKGDWNDFEITAKGNHIVIKINGTTVIDRTDPEIAKSGVIALQLHVWPDPMEVRFKDLEIKELNGAK
ncbi:DUF1080 domain-containing protein [Isosphaeraceae bacterium EP7]